MPERYVEAILKYLSERDYQPLKPRQLARQMGVSDEEYGSFRDAIKRLRDSGRIVLGAKDALTLPQIANRVTGHYTANPRGFGFVVPETPNSHGDLFIPPGASGGAMTGDFVVATVQKQGKREGRDVMSGQIVEIIRRGRNQFVGVLERAKGAWFVIPDGKQMTTPIVIRDVGAAGPKAGAKVVVEIIHYGGEGELPNGVLVETLGEQGQLAVETQSIIRAHGLEDKFSPEALEDARRALEAFNPQDFTGRQDLTRETIITIDPPDARDYDDAISLTEKPGGGFVLGVHIADVSNFIPAGSALDKEARQRATSVYFPRRVVPMLPEVLSNGICSLQEGENRYCKTAFIEYDAQGNRTASRYCESVIASARRLTYTQAQDIIDGRSGDYPPAVVELVQRMDRVARVIEARRRKAGMIHLDLPDVELVFDEDNRVIDAVPEDTAYTHTIIEMFMVEANEVVAELMNRLNRPCLRRIHPSPDQQGSKQLTLFVHACGHKLPADLSRKDIQRLLETVKGRPESFAVNLAVLKTFEQAVYSPMQIGHFALGSEHYCHFTSPIRRYPDLTVHRLFADYCRGRMSTRPPEDLSELTKLGDHCSGAERRAQAAEDELREVLVLQFLATKVGETFDGVITGVTNFGMFVQSRRFLVDGLVRFQDLGDDWWEVDARRGCVRGEMSGQSFRIGDVLTVTIAAVDVARRQLNLAPAGSKFKKPKGATRPPKAGAPRKPLAINGKGGKKQPHKKHNRRGRSRR